MVVEVTWTEVEREREIERGKNLSERERGKNCCQVGKSRS